MLWSILCVRIFSEVIHKNIYKEITWIDLENPTTEEVRLLMKKYDLDPLVANEILTPTFRPRVDVHQDYIYLILHFPIPLSKNTKKEDESQHKIQEIDFIIGKKFIITTHYETVDALHDFSKVFEVNSILSKIDIGSHAGYIFFFMIQYLYRMLHNQVESIRDTIGAVEDNIFKGKEKECLLELSQLKRTLLTLKSSMSAHKEVISAFETAAEDFFGSNFKYHSRAIFGEYQKVKNSVNSIKEYLDELRETNNSLLYAKQNETMRVFTVLAFFTFPLSLFSSILGMNMQNIPLADHPNGFWIVVALMLAVTILMIIFFKNKKLL